MFPDVPGYAGLSMSWRLPFSDFHVPGYALLIAMTRGLTLGMFSDFTLMYAINYFAMITCCFGVLRLCASKTLDFAASSLLTGSFTLWPLLGLNAIVSPLADVPAMAFFIWGIVQLLECRIWKAAILFGVGMLCHKGLWPFVALVLAGDYLASRRSFAQKIGMLALTGGPVIVLWIWGATYQGNPFWILSASVAIGVESRNAYFPFEGLWNTISQDGLKGFAKGSVVLCLVAFAFTCVTWAWQLERQARWIALGIAGATLFWLAFLTKVELLAGVRFSRLLVLIPALYLANQTGAESTRRKLGAWVAALILLLLTSQFAAAWYMHQRLTEDGISLKLDLIWPQRIAYSSRTIVK